MTTYNAATVTDAIIAYKKAVTLQILRQLRDNPLAMFEGSAGAPRLQLAAIDTWYLTAGAIGTYCFAAGTADVAFGATAAGSTLNPTSAAQAVFAGSGNATLQQGAALTGTWQCMGKFDASIVNGTLTLNGATLWQRIA